MLILITLVSVLVSAFGSLIGFGGGIFLVPVLVLVFHYSMPASVGSVIVALVPASLLNTVFNHRNGCVDYKTGLLLEAPTVPGVFLGSLLLAVIPAQTAKIVFVILISALSLSFFKGKKPGQRRSRFGDFFDRMNRTEPRITIANRVQNVSYSLNLPLAAGLGLSAGLVAGFFGVGGGFLKTPIMIKIFRIPAKIAAGTGLFMILITSSVGSISHALLGHISAEQALPVVVGFSLGAVLIKPFQRRISHERVERLIGAALALSAAIMAVEYFWG